MQHITQWTYIMSPKYSKRSVAVGSFLQLKHIRVPHDLRCLDAESYEPPPGHWQLKLPWSPMVQLKTLPQHLDVPCLGKY